jgi:hypothetical protein
LYFIIDTDILDGKLHPVRSGIWWKDTKGLYVPADPKTLNLELAEA